MISGMALGWARPGVRELNFEPVDLRYELRHGVQLCLGLPPIVVGAPVVQERLDLRQLHALGSIGDLSRSGHRVAAMRRRRSTSAASGMPMRKGRIALSPVAGTVWAKLGAASRTAPSAPETGMRSKIYRTKVSTTLWYCLLRQSHFILYFGSRERLASARRCRRRRQTDTKV